MPHSDVVIIGAGAIGCSIAYHLSKRGMRASVVERESIGTRASGKAWAVIAYPPTLFHGVPGVMASPKHALSAAMSTPARPAKHRLLYVLPSTPQTGSKYNGHDLHSPG